MTDHGELVEIVAEAVRPWMDGSAEYVARAAIGALDLPARDRQAKREVLEDVMEQINDCGAGLYPPNPEIDQAFARGARWALEQIEVELTALAETETPT